MNIRHLVSVACIFLGGFEAGSALAAPKLQAYPVTLLGYQGDDLRIGVELPCGSSYYGLITNTDGKGKLSIAAATLQPDILCTGLPSRQEILVKYLATTGFKTIASLDTDNFLNRLMMIPATSVMTVKRKGNKLRLSAVYETRCGESVGTLIRQSDSSQLEVAIVELRPKQRPSQGAEGKKTGGADTCGYDQKLQTITAIALNEGYQVQAIVAASVPAAKSIDLRKASYLRLASIDSSSLNAQQQLLTQQAGVPELLPAKPIVVRYFRACNEAPIGVVVSKPTVQVNESGRHTTVGIGVMVAHFYNKTCAAGERGEWTEIVASDLSLSARLIAMPATSKLGELTLRAPFEMNRLAKTGRAADLMIDYFRPLNRCEETLGAVYARDGSDRLAVGIVTKSASSCKKITGPVSSGVSLRVSSKTLSEVSYQASMTQPFLSRHVRAADLYPMRLKGIM